MLNGAKVAPTRRKPAGSLSIGRKGLERFAIEVDRKLQLAIGCITKRQARLEVIGLCNRRSDGSSPANGEALCCRITRQAGNGICECPVEVEFLIDANHFRSALEAGLCEVFSLQAFDG